MSHDSFDWTKLILDNWKVIAAVLVFFGAGSGLGFVVAEKREISEVQIEVPEKAKISEAPCICQCGITKHLKKAH